ncbi:MAG: 7-cyano-7-deazaguanine synthase, partial [Planctomycetaceae bacterium]|nr:7-cyano-7-deazaguanine synthase [Planctomycetaceae bacterium]
MGKRPVGCYPARPVNAPAPRPRAVCLLSGGMDSAVTLAEARAAGFDAIALTVRYGQTHAREVEAARRVAASLGVTKHVELDLPLGEIARSALTGVMPVPKDRP